MNRSYQQIILYLPCLLLTVVSCSGGGPTTRLSPGGDATVYVFVPDANPGDTLHLFLYSRFYPALEDDPLIPVDRRVEPDGWCRFTLPARLGYGYFSIGKDKHLGQGDNALNLVMPVTPIHYWEGGDSLRIRLDSREHAVDAFTPEELYRFDYSGRGAAKYGLEDLLDSAMHHTTVRPPPLFDSVFHYHDPSLALRQAAEKILEEHKEGLSEAAYEVFLGDIRFANSHVGFISVMDYYRALVKKGDSVGAKRMQQSWERRDWDAETRPDRSNALLARSRNYQGYTLMKLTTLEWFHTGREDRDSVYDAIRQEYRGVLRDQLLVACLLMGNTGPGDLERDYRDAARLIRDPYCRTAFDKMSNRLRGSRAYEFLLPDSSGQLVRLSDWRGKVVLIDTWFTGCGGCAMLYRNMLEKMETMYKDRKDVVVVSISTDRDRGRWLKGIASGRYTSPLAINLYTAGLETDHPFIKYYRIVKYPTLILVDPEGNIASFDALDLYREDGLKDRIRKALR